MAQVLCQRNVACVAHCVRMRQVEAATTSLWDFDNRYKFRGVRHLTKFTTQSDTVIYQCSETVLLIRQHLICRSFNSLNLHFVRLFFIMLIIFPQ